MIPVGKICNLAINYCFNSTGPKNNEKEHIVAARKKLVNVLSKVTPGDYKSMPMDQENGLVVGFNHPSLGEIARILLMKIDIMGEKPMYFPVNLPWYEALAPNFNRIKKLGIIITPTITPATWKKINLKKDTALYEVGEKIKRNFRDVYIDLSRQAMLDGGVIFVAPSATRQATVFKNKAAYEKKEEIIPTMSMLALKLLNDKKINCDFLPMAVLPPENYKRGLNLGKKYQLIPGEILTAAEIRKKYFKKNNTKHLVNFDWDFHKRIADKLPKEFWY